mgnify:CR=1 FL=1
MPEFEPFRPIFSRRLASRLIKGQVLHLRGEDRQGATRLAKDMAELMAQAIYLDGNEHSAADLFQRIAQPEVKDWPSLLEYWHINQTVACLILNHARADFLGETEAEIQDTVKRISALPGVGMLLVQSDTLPELDALDEVVERYPLPPIGYKRLKEEILRHFPEEQNWNAIAGPIFAHPEPYPFLQFVLQKRAEKPDWSKRSPEDWLSDLTRAFNQKRGLQQPSDDAAKGGFWRRLRI